MMAHSDPTLAGVSVTIPVQFAGGALGNGGEESARSGSSGS